jgi:catechol 2,3-dioxygenase-like lactoylglutathione lyase family enzyme
MLKALHPVVQAHDVAESIAFYQNLGFTPTFQDNPENPRYAAVTRDNIELHLQWADPTQWAYPIDRPIYRILVDDPDALYEAFLAGGAINTQTGDGSPWRKPADTPWGTREFHLRDPGQNSLQFYQAK